MVNPYVLISLQFTCFSFEIATVGFFFPQNIFSVGIRGKIKHLDNQLISFKN